MKERPLLFPAPMVRAILAGTKTQTRRPMKDQPCQLLDFNRGRLSIRVRGAVYQAFSPEFPPVSCPYGRPGDRLWVRETWRHTATDLDEARCITEDIASGTAVDYRATYIEQCMRELGFSREDAEVADSFEVWRPSIHMPRWASRILLEITAARVERLQAISEADAKAEGIQYDPGEGGTFYVQGLSGCASDTAADSYRKLWESTYGPDSWASNPWVWVVEFRRVA